MAITNPTLPTIGEPNSSADADVLNALTAILAELNGNLDNNNLKASAGIVADKLAIAVKQALGLNETGVVRRGASVITAEGTRTNAAYGALDNGPDQVQNVVLPTNGLIAVYAHSLWKSGSGGPARAALFIGANQLKVNRAGIVAPVTSAGAPDDTSFGVYGALSSCPLGLGGTYADTDAQVVTTGQAMAVANSTFNSTAGLGIELAGTRTNIDVVGGPCFIFAAAGTYTLSLQWKTTDGSQMWAKERKLLVETIGFS